MKNCHTKLKELIEEVVLPDIEDELDNIYEIVAKDKKSNEEQTHTLQYLHEMRDEFKTVLEEIEQRNLTQEECIELYEEIQEMISDEEEE